MSEHANQNENDIKNTEERPDLSGDAGAQFSDADLEKVAAGGPLIGSLIGKAIGKIASNQNDEAGHAKRSESATDEIALKS